MYKRQVQALIAPPENPIPCGSNNDNVQNESRHKISDQNKRRKNRKE